MVPQALAAAGNLLLYGDERLPAGSAAAIEVAKATQCDHNPPRGRGGGDMTSDSSSSSSSSGASSATDLVSRLGIMGGGYSDLSASGTARGLLYLQVMLKSKDTVFRQLSEAFLLNISLQLLLGIII